ncbi:MAG: hypothetical protein ACQEQE_07035 [Bacillota bacterium]
MAKIIDFENHLNEKNEKEKSKDKDLNDSKETTYRPKNNFSNYQFSLMADYDERNLYINVKFGEYDINVDVGVNLKLLKSLADDNPMLQIDTEIIKAVTKLDDQFVQAIFKVYKEFEFIDPNTRQIRPLEDVAKSYINKRIKYGYPKSKKKFKKVIALEREVFSEFLKDPSIFNEKLYWKVDNRY